MEYYIYTFKIIFLKTMTWECSPDVGYKTINVYGVIMQH